MHVILPLIVWGRQPQTNGYVCIATSQHGKNWKETWYLYPNDKVKIIEHVNSAKQQCTNCYYSPLIWPTAKRTSQNAPLSTWAWVDIDHPGIPTDPKPTILVATSPGRWQGLYLLDRPLPPEQLQKLNQQLAKQTGADHATDPSRVLRVPDTININHDPYSISSVAYVDLNIVYPVQIESKPNPITELEEQLNKLVEDNTSIEELLAKYNLPSDVIELATTPKPKGERSHAFAKLCEELISLYLPDEDIYKILKASAVNKFRGRQDEHKRIISEIEKQKERVRPIILIQEEDEDDPASDTPEEPDVLVELFPKRGEDDWLYDFVHEGQHVLSKQGFYAPKHFLFGCGVSLLSLITGRLEPYGSGMCSIYAINVGATNTGKTSALRLATDVYYETTTAQKRENIEHITSIGSYQGLAKAVSESKSNTVWYTVDEGVMSIAQFLSEYARAGKGLLSTVWSGMPYNHRTAREKLKCPARSNIAWIINIDPENIKRLITAEDIAQGLAFRFVILTQYASREYDPPSQAVSEPSTVTGWIVRMSTRWQQRWDAVWGETEKPKVELSDSARKRLEESMKPDEIRKTENLTRLAVARYISRQVKIEGNKIIITEEDINDVANTLKLIEDKVKKIFDSITTKGDLSYNLQTIKNATKDLYIQTKNKRPKELRKEPVVIPHELFIELIAKKVALRNPNELYQYEKIMEKEGWIRVESGSLRVNDHYWCPDNTQRAIKTTWVQILGGVTK